VRLIAELRWKTMFVSGSRQMRLSPPSNDPRVIAAHAGKMMEAMFQPGGVYTKCGVLLEELVPEGTGQADFFAAADPRAPGLLAAMDGLNDRFGRGTIQLAAQGFGGRSFDMKRSQKSPSWTTDIHDIPVAR
jgi:DNA polymerase V